MLCKSSNQLVNCATDFRRGFTLSSQLPYFGAGDNLVQHIIVRFCGGRGRRRGCGCCRRRSSTATATAAAISFPVRCSLVSSASTSRSTSCSERSELEQFCEEP